MKLNKLIALLLAVTMLFAFVGCPNGNEPQKEPDTPDTPDTPVTPVETIVAVVKFTPKAGLVPTGSKISLATETEGADIYYEIVTGDAAATLTKENATTFTKYTEPFEAVEGTVYAIAVKEDKTSEITSAAYTVKDIEIDSIRLWNEESKEKAFKVYNVEDLQFLAEVVNEVGYDFEGVTITLANDINIQAEGVTVLKDGFLEPDETVAEDGVTPAPAAGLVNLDSIGHRNAGFAGTFDGAGHVIKGLYIYQAHQGLGFIGYAAEGAVIKDLTIVDACVINSNLSGAEDGSDDDRFGGLIGISANAVVENCVFVGVVGSAAAKGRGGAYEYVGVIGRPDNATEVKNTFGVVRIYGVPNGHGDASANITAENYIVLDANNRPANNPDDGKFNTREEEGFVVLGADEWAFQNKYTSDNQYIKDAIAAIEASLPQLEFGKLAIEKAIANITEHADVTAAADIKDGIVEGVTEYKVTDAEGINKLAEIVTGGNKLEGYTITLANDIKLQAEGVTVLKEGFLEPDETVAEDGVTPSPAAALVNYDSIGNRSNAFAGTFDGNGYTVSGFYAYQGHQGLGFFGNVAGATIKNFALRDACVINCNAKADDGSDDDRFGGLIGLVTGDNTVIENVIFEGVVGSAAAHGRGKTEYVGGLVGRADNKATVTNCIVLARIYAEQSFDVINNKGKDNLTLTNVVGYDAAK